MRGATAWVICAKLSGVETFGSYRVVRYDFATVDVGFRK